MPDAVRLYCGGQIVRSLGQVSELLQVDPSFDSGQQDAADFAGANPDAPARGVLRWRKVRPAHSWDHRQRHHVVEVSAQLIVQNFYSKVYGGGHRMTVRWDGRDRHQTDSFLQRAQQSRTLD